MVVNQAPSPEILSVNSFCQGDTVTLAADQNYAVYNWQDNSTDSIFRTTIGGTYSLTVTDVNGCIGQTDKSIIQFSSPTPSINGIDEFCTGETVNISVNRNFSAFEWSSGDSTQSIAISQGGNYEVTVTDARGCQASAQFQVTENSLPDFSIQGDNEICDYEQTTFTVSNEYNRYSWNTGAGTQTITADTAGTYIVEVEDVNGCVDTRSIDLIVNPTPSPILMGGNSLCENDTLTLNVTEAFPIIQWSTGSNQSSEQFVESGTYQLSVTDVNGCANDTTFELIQFTNPELNLIGNQFFCEGLNTTIGSSETYSSYLWSDGSTESTLSINTPGTYSLNVLDENGCPASETFVVEQFTNPDPSIVGNLTYCANESTTLGLDQAYFAYRWSGNEATDTLVVTNPGNYSVTVFDDRGCIGIDDVDVTALTIPRPNILGNQTFCEDDTIRFTVEQTFDQYLWSTGSTEQAIDIDLPGTYEVTVTDGNGCSGSSDLQAIQFSKPRPVLSGNTTFCEEATSTISAPSGFIDYSWSTGQTLRQITVSTAGTYTVTVTDARGCTGVDSVLIETLENPKPLITGDTVICQGEQAAVQLTEDYFAYVWSSGENTPNITPSIGGMYTVTVFDSRGCSGTDQIEVIVNERPDPLITGAVTFCPEDTIQIDVGQHNTYLWSNGSTGRSISLSDAGTYSVTVTNSNNCTEAAFIQIDTFATPELAITGDPFFCEGNFTSLGATPGYPIYNWSNGNNSDQLAISIPGEYSLEIRDDNGCRNSQSITVDEVSLPDPSIIGPNSLCDNEDRVLVLTQEYTTYDWSNGETTASITVAQEGLYRVIVTDSFGCVGADTIRLIPEQAPDYDILGPDNLCPGDTATLFVDPSFSSYLWNDGNSESSRTIMQPGVYVLTVEADNGCRTTKTKEIISRPQPVIDFEGDFNICFGESSNLTVQDTFLTYEWNTGSLTNNIVADTAGLYSVTVSNQFGCFNNKSINISQFELVENLIIPLDTLCTGDSLILNAGNNFMSYEWSNGSTEALILVDQGGVYSVTLTDRNGCIQEIDAEVQEFTPQEPVIAGVGEVCIGNSAQLFALGGYESYLWSTNDTTEQINISSGGTYSVRVVDRNGCVEEVSREITEKPSPRIDVIGRTFFCEGTSLILSVDADQGEILWSNLEETDSILINTPGLYSALVRAPNGCTSVDSIRVQMLENPEPEIDGLQQICSNEVGELTLDQAYSQMLWSTNSREQSITVSTTGTYSVTVTDPFNCVGTESFDVTVVDAPEPTIVGVGDICIGDTLVLGLEKDYMTYSWSTGSDSSSIALTEPNIVFVEVIDSNGCEGIGDFTVVQAPQPEITFTGDSTFCVGSFTRIGVADEFSTYRWSNGQRSRSIDIFDPDTYVLTVTNEFGCEDIRSILVDTISRPIAIVGPDVEVNCSEPATQLISDGSSIGFPYLYSWTGPDITDENRNDEEPLINLGGLYTLVITDTVNQCISPTASVDVQIDFQSPTAQVMVDTILTCDKKEVELSVSTLTSLDDIVISWRDPNGQTVTPKTNGDFMVSMPGTYTATIRDLSTDCDVEKTVEVLGNFLPPQIDAGEDVILDCNVEATTLDASNSDFGPSYELQWRSLNGDSVGNANTPFPFIYSPGVYELEIRRIANGCVSLDTINVFQDTDAPTADAGRDTSLNCLSATLRLDGSGSYSPGDGITYKWTSTENPTFLSIRPGPAISRPGVYRLEVTNTSNGCRDVDSVLVMMGETGPEEIDYEIISPTCFGDTNGSITINNISGGMDPYLVSFQFGALSSNTQFTNLVEGTYNLVIEDANGCAKFDTIVLDEGRKVGVELGPDQTIRFGETASIIPFLGVPENEIDIVNWVPMEMDEFNCLDNNCIEVEVSPPTTTSYNLQITDIAGCFAEDFITIFVEDTVNIYIPNVFSNTLDAEQENRYFTIFGDQGLDRIGLLQIYDRWGNLVFEKRNFPHSVPIEGWNGMIDGKEGNQGVYVYYVELIRINGEVIKKKGDLTLIR
ncbi:MAG: gliding motility-associated C-terminal domain-containing protein [Bacteroidota bacterium]